MTLMAELAETAQDRPIVALAIVGILFAAIWTATVERIKWPETLPWVGKDDTKAFALTRATFASFNNVQQWLAQGYNTVCPFALRTLKHADPVLQYSQKGKSYIFPDFSGRHEIVLPNDKLKWLTEQPDNVASVREAHYDVLQGDYAFTTPCEFPLP